MTTLIVPRGYATGKPNRRPVANPFAGAIRRRLSAAHQRWVGPAWKGVPEHAGGLREAPGRKVGCAPGTHIDDMIQLRKSIVLCDTCSYRFSPKRVKYYRDEIYGARVLSPCDGCREYSQRGQLFLPEERLTNSSGIAEPGQVWKPK